MNELTFRIESASLNAWPARRQAIQWGWLLRIHEGYTRRANSVQPIFQPPAGVRPPPLEERIQAVEDFYRRHSQPAIFKMTPLVEPPELDAVLARRGYSREAPTGVWIRTLPDKGASRPNEDQLAREEHVQIGVSEALTDEWLQAFLACSGTSAEVASRLRGILSGVTGQSRFFTLQEAGASVAVALSVQENDLVGMFDVAVAPSARGQGYGQVLLRRILDVAARQGARLAYLQVMEDNLPARRLYERFGFRPLYPYWYRVQPG